MTRENDRYRPAHRSVFLDETGRRRKVAIVLGAAAGTVLCLAIVLLVAGLAGGGGGLLPRLGENQPTVADQHNPQSSVPGSTPTPGSVVAGTPGPTPSPSPSGGSPSPSPQPTTTPRGRSSHGASHPPHPTKSQ